jgi:recombination protein RecR
MNGPIEELVEQLTRLPGIGRKSAWRIALHILDTPEDEVAKLSRALDDAKRRIVKCRRCFTYSESELCSICSSATRDNSTICVVEKSSDVFAIEKIGRYRGTYHVLGGVLSPLAGITPDRVRLGELTQRVADEHPAELIIGLGGGAEAETTAAYIARLYRNAGVRITRLARGLPAGMEIEYVDQLTLGQALNERTDIHYGES